MTERVPPRRYRDADLKRLFALSYNECAFPPCEERLARPEWPRVQCEIAHIYGLAPNSPRYRSEMSDEERNAFENLILFCRNHHNLVDYLEPGKYPAENLLDMKWAHEQRRGDRSDWCPEPVLDDYVRKLVLSLDIHVVATGERPPIRSSPRTNLPDTKEPETTRSRRSRNIRVHELAKELGMTNEETVNLCAVLGVPVKSRSSSLNEAYADMVRRRAARDGLTRDEQPASV